MTEVRTMNNNKIFIVPLGNVIIIDVYLFYDGPQIVSCIDEVGQKYFCMNVDSDEEGDIWYFVAVSSERLRNIECDKITLFKTLTEPETGSLYKVKVCNSGANHTAKHISPSMLNADILPDEDVYLETNLDVNCHDDYEKLSEKKTMLVIGSNSQTEAVYLNRDILDISLEPNGSHTHEIDTESLGLTLYRLQSFIKSHGVKNIPVKNNRQRAQFEDRFALNARGFYAASFGIRLAAKHPAGMFGQSHMYETLDSVIRLLDSPSSNLLDLMKDLDYRTISRYRFLLRTLKKSNASLKASWSSPSKETRHSQLSLDDINSVLVILGKEELNMNGVITLVGKLIAIDSERNTFKFRDYEDQVYIGKLSENLKSESVFHVSRDEQALVQVKLEEFIEINPTTQEENFSYVLLEVNYNYNDEAPDNNP